MLSVPIGKEGQWREASDADGRLLKTIIRSLRVESVCEAVARTWRCRGAPRRATNSVWKRPRSIHTASSGRAVRIWEGAWSFRPRSHLTRWRPSWSSIRCRNWLGAPMRPPGSFWRRTMACPERRFIILRDESAVIEMLRDPERIKRAKQALLTAAQRRRKPRKPKPRRE